MKMTLAEAFEMIERGETPEQYEKRMTRIRRLANERDDLVAGISVFGPDSNDPRLEKKKARLEKLQKMINELL